MADIFSNHSASLISPAGNAAAVTPHNDDDLLFASRALYIGGAGNVAVVMAGGETVTFRGLAAGSLLPVRVTRVLATGTTATLIVAVW